MEVLRCLFYLTFVTAALAHVIGDLPHDPKITLNDIGYEAPDSRIVGGSNAAEGQFPYQCSLRSAANAHFCGCSIVNNRWVVSAAHCTIDRTPANTLVVVGTTFRLTGGVTHPVAQIRNHENYNGNTIAFDVCTVQTVNPIAFNAHTQPIPLATAHLQQSPTGIVSGWGVTSHPNGSPPNNLQFLAVNILTHEDCRARHTIINAQLVFDHKICSFSQNGQGICFGDSGGPLTNNGLLEGIASWVIPCGVGRPDVYDRVSAHHQWIVGNMPA